MLECHCMEELKKIAIKDIQTNPFQPRKHFDQEKLLELAQSIRENGIIQPIIVRKSSLIGYELLAGERRLRASQLAGLKEIPALVKELSDDQLMLQAIIENLQRSDLNPIEEAASYQKLIEKGLTHDEIAQIMGKSRPYISNLLRLLSLSNRTITAIETGEISQGHARLLIGLPESKQVYWIERIQQEQLSVRWLENALKKKKKQAPPKTNLFLKEQETELQKLLGTMVTIRQQKSGQGKLSLSFDSNEEFERIINTLKKLCD